MSSQAETADTRNDLTARVDEAISDELEADVPPEELDMWVDAFLRERVT